MARIAGVDLPKGKPIWVALQSIYGIGSTSSQRILATTGVDPSIRVKDLTEEHLRELVELIKKS